MVDRVVDLTGDHVTITINTLDAHIAAEIYKWIFINGQKYSGVEAGQILIERQMEGLRKLQEKGVLVKVNSVFIPQRNGLHLPELSRELARHQVFLHNIMPLIAKPEHGTHFGLTGEPEPTPEQVNQVREACGHDVSQMSHCQQCRADAIGLLGEDRSQEFSVDNTPTEQPDYFEVMHQRTRLQADLVTSGAASDDDAKLVAVASESGQLIDQHFGYAESFAIYSVTSEGVSYVNRRHLPKYCKGPNECDDEQENEHNVFNLLADMDAVFCSRVGLGPWKKLEDLGIAPQVGYAWKAIDVSLMDWWREQPVETSDLSKLKA
jgi:nitrogen fixation protein NifB